MFVQDSTAELWSDASAPEASRGEGCRADAVLTRPFQAGTLLAAARLFVPHFAPGADLHP
jgi:hypothetical protein